MSNLLQTQKLIGALPDEVSEDAEAASGSDPTINSLYEEGVS